MRSYNFTGDALAIARYNDAALGNGNGIVDQNGRTKVAVTAPTLAGKCLDAEAAAVRGVLDQFSGTVKIEQPAGTVVATFTPEAVSPLE